ncbi:unnamed protein product [Mytilus coruscus]|uniref:Uncharacterized protein n=1 Tax=Mytilus coruscus TaxID=42192 RepID=A0A6J8B6W6_MYTCO|nr:unnamed protein product [Mytilus coruscus]
MFQILIRDQEFKQQIADAKRIARECLSLDFNDNRSQDQLKSNRKYESEDESDGDKLLKVTAILQDILPKYFVRQLKDKETQTDQTYAVDTSVQTESENTVSTDKLTTLMGDALVNVPDQAVGYIKDFLQSSLNGIVNNSTMKNPIDQPCHDTEIMNSHRFSKPNFMDDNNDFETRMKPINAEIIDVCKNRMESIARSIFKEMMFDHLGANQSIVNHRYEWNQKQFPTNMYGVENPDKTQTIQYGHVPQEDISQYELIGFTTVIPGNHGDRIDDTNENIQSISVSPPTTFKYFSSQCDLRDKDIHQINSTITSMPSTFEYHSSESQMHGTNVQRGDFTPTESWSHPSTLSYYMPVSAIPYNWAADAPDPYDDIADDEYLREKLFVPKLDLSFMDDNPPVISDHDTDSSIWSFSSCESEGAFKNWLKRNGMYMSEDSGSISSSIPKAPRGKKRSNDDEGFKMSFNDSYCKEDDKKDGITDYGSEYTVQRIRYIRQELNETEKAVKRRILGRLNEKRKSEYTLEMAEIAENIVTERSMNLFTAQSDALDTFRSISVLSSCETYDDFKNWLNTDDSYKPEEINRKSEDINYDTIDKALITMTDYQSQEKDKVINLEKAYDTTQTDLALNIDDITENRDNEGNVEPQIAKRKKTVNGEISNQIVIATANEKSSPSDLDDIDPRLEADRERRILKAANWVRAVDIYLQRKQALKESESLFKIGDVSEYDLGSSGTSMTTSSDIEQPPIIKSDTSQDKGNHLGRMGDVELNEEKRKFVGAIGDAEQPKEMIDQRSDIFPNSHCGSMDSTDIDITSILGSDIDKREGDAAKATIDNRLTDKSRFDLQEKDTIADETTQPETLSINETTKPKEQVERILFGKPPLPPNNYYRSQDVLREKATPKDNLDRENKETKTNEYTNNVTSKRTESCEEEYNDENTESSAAETVSSEYPSYESDFSEELQDGDSGKHITTTCQLAVAQKDICDEKQVSVYNHEKDAESKTNGTEMLTDVVQMVEGFKTVDSEPPAYTRMNLSDADEAKTRNIILGTGQSFQKMYPIHNSKAANQCFDNDALSSDCVYLEKVQNANDEESFTVSSATFDSFFGYDNPDEGDDNMPYERDEILMKNRQHSFKMNEKSVELITETERQPPAIKLQGDKLRGKFNKSTCEKQQLKHKTGTNQIGLSKENQLNHEEKNKIDTEIADDESRSTRQTVSTSMETKSKNNTENHHIKGSTLPPVKQIEKVSTETEFHSNIGLNNRKIITPKSRKSKNDNEGNHDTGFTKQDTNKLDEMVSKESKISRLIKQHSNAENEDQLRSSKQNDKSPMITNTVTVSSAVRERQFGNDNLLRKIEGDKQSLQNIYTKNDFPAAYQCTAKDALSLDNVYSEKEENTRDEELCSVSSASCDSFFGYDKPNDGNNDMPYEKDKGDKQSLQDIYTKSVIPAARCALFPANEYSEKEENTMDEELDIISNASWDSFFGYDDPDDGNNDMPYEKDEILMNNRQQGFKMHEKSAERLTETKKELSDISLQCTKLRSKSNESTNEKQPVHNDSGRIHEKLTKEMSFDHVVRPYTETEFDKVIAYDENISSTKQNLSASLVIESKNNTNKHHLKESTILMSSEQNKMASSTETQLHSNIDSDGSTGLENREINSPKITKSKNDNECHSDTGFIEQSATTLVDMVAKESKISRLTKNHSNIESDDQKEPLKQNASKIPMTTKTHSDTGTIMESVRQRRIGHNNLLRKNEDEKFEKSKLIKRKKCVEFDKPKAEKHQSISGSDDVSTESSVSWEQHGNTIDGIRQKQKPRLIEHKSTEMQVESNSDNSLSKRNVMSEKCIHNETIGSFHDDALSNIKADPSLGVSMPGSCVLYNGALIITDGGGDETSDDGSVIDMPVEELKKWKTARETIKNKIRKTESNRSCESFNQVHKHLQAPSQSLLAPGFLQRRGTLAPISPNQEAINKKDHNSKSVKKTSKKKKKKKTKDIKKETMQWPEPKQVEIETHCDSSTGSFSMPSFELAEDLPLKSTENLSATDTNVSVDLNDHLSSNPIESLKHVRFKEDDEIFIIDSYESSDEKFVENDINSKDISEKSFQSLHEEMKRKRMMTRRKSREDMNRRMNEDFTINSYESSDSGSCDSLARRKSREDMNRKMNEDFTINSYESSDSGSCDSLARRKSREDMNMKMNEDFTINSYESSDSG